MEPHDLSAVVPAEIDLADIDLEQDVIASRVHSVMLRAYGVEASLIGTDAIPALHESVEEMRCRPLRWLGAFSADGSVVAFVAWTMHADAGSGSTVALDRVCVDPAWFRRGLARGLVLRCLGLSGAASVTVSAAEDNTPAIALYSSLGFRPSGAFEPIPGLRMLEFMLTPRRPHGVEGDIAPRDIVAPSTRPTTTEESSMALFTMHSNPYVRQGMSPTPVSHVSPHRPRQADD